MKKPLIPSDLEGEEVVVAHYDPRLEHALMVEQRFIDKRRIGAMGRVKSMAAGHGGDVYWVAHDGAQAPYGYWELELL